MRFKTAHSSWHEWWSSSLRFIFSFSKYLNVCISGGQTTECIGGCPNNNLPGMCLGLAVVICPQCSWPSPDTDTAIYECESGLMMMTQSRPRLLLSSEEFCANLLWFVTLCLSHTISKRYTAQWCYAGVHPLFAAYNVTTLTVFFSPAWTPSYSCTGVLCPVWPLKDQRNHRIISLSRISTEQETGCES